MLGHPGDVGHRLREHVVVAVGDGVTPYRGSLAGKLDQLWKQVGVPDPLAWGAFVASRARTIKLGANVVILPEPQPSVFAKTAETVISQTADL